MSDIEIWLTIAALCLATAITRSGFWLVGHHITIPPRIQQMLRFAPACALAAIIGPDMLIDGAGRIEPVNIKLLAGLASLGYYLLRRNMLETIIFGMVVLTLLRLLHVF
jgi:branched-subunit amino acid transport protein